MQFLDAEAVSASTPWSALIDSIAEILMVEGANAPPRHVHSFTVPADAGHQNDSEASLLLMPSWIEGAHIGVKAVTYVPSNAGTDIPTINAAYLLFSATTGQVEAVLDGDELTARRTAAVSALAASSLARTDADRLLVVGTGQLAPNIARAYCSIRSLADIVIWGRNTASAAAVARLLRDEGLPARSATDLDAEVTQANVIACVTGATAPLVKGALLQPGTHLDLIGSFRPDMRESDDEAVTRSTIVVDTRSGALLSGDLAQPLAAGVITPSAIKAELVDLVSGSHPGRISEEEITVFKSAGFALADLAAARLAVGSQLLR